MRRCAWMRSAVVLTVGVLALGVRPATANPDWTKKERKQCVYCHVGTWDSGKYTEAGQYYKDHQFSFKGYVPKPDSAKTQATGKKAEDKR
jgi:hypothetical protein